MNHEPQSNFEADQPSPAFDRLRDRKRARRSRIIRTVSILLLCAALLTGAALYAHKAVLQPYLNAPIPTPESPASTQTQPEQPSDASPAPTPEPDPEPTSEPAEPEPEPEPDPEPLQPALALAQSTEETKTLDLEIYSSAAVLVDVQSGTVLAEKNPDAKIYPASMTKIMTLLVAAENLPDLDATFTMTQAIIDPIYLAGASMAGFVDGETVTMLDLLYGAVVPSGAEATQALAQAVAGSEDGFVALMNEKAQELGMEHSSFANSNGLDDEQHYSTARDMAKLARAALENETLMRIASTRSVTIGGRTMTNHNKLLRYVDGCLGLKTGYTKAAGRTLVSCAEKNGQRLIAVTLQDGNDWADHRSLYEYGFSAYPARTCAVRGQALTQASVSGGVSPTVPLIAGAGFCYPAAETERLTTRICLDEPLRAPVSAGKTVGAAVF